MKKIVVFAAMVFLMACMTIGASFAEAASDKGITKSFSEEELRELWELFEKFSEEKLQREIEEISITLDKIEGMQDDGDDAWKGLIMPAFVRAWNLYQNKPGMPETSLLVARSFYYNGKPKRAINSLRKTFYYGRDFVGAHILDVAAKFSEAELDSTDDGVDFLLIEKFRKDYEKILGMDGVQKEDESKVFYRIGFVYANRAFSKKKAKVYWQKSYDAAPDSYWGKRAKKLLENNS
ncbi:hypothetical protein MNBD_DELTA01-1271 [hydrothermal vent metagenome]|uniref:Uncharacterized protein n=1 Tax=hydrothermal vent metagenome TaxID=652676 RepID=A0A3B0RC99_9ZZZZ